MNSFWAANVDQSLQIIILNPSCIYYRKYSRQSLPKIVNIWHSSNMNSAMMATGAVDIMNKTIAIADSNSTVRSLDTSISFKTNAV